jgi:hypothetical protein
MAVLEQLLNRYFTPRTAKVAHEFACSLTFATDAATSYYVNDTGKKKDKYSLLRGIGHGSVF